MFLRKNWLPLSVFIVVIVAVGLYLLTTQQTPKDPIVIIKPAEVETKPKPPPPGETAESGHWHGDEWHTGSHDAHAPAEVSDPPNDGTAETQDSPARPRREPAEWVSWDFQAAYQGIREKYPDQTQNPHPFENVPVNLWDFEATKKAFMENFNFYVAHYDPKEGWPHTRELRIAEAIMENIDNAAEPWFGLFTPEQCKEIEAMYRELRKFEGYISPIDKIMEEKGVTREVAIRISTYEKLKSKGWSDEEIPAHYREAGK